MTTEELPGAAMARARAVAGETSGGRVVVVDDDLDVLGVLSRVLRQAGFEVLPFDSATEAIAAIAANPTTVDAVVSDRQMPEMDGMALLAEVRDRWPDLPFILLTGDVSPASVIEAMRQGAYDYLSKSFDNPSEIAPIIARAIDRRRLLGRNRSLEVELELADRFSEIVAQSPGMRAVLQRASTVAATDATVLLYGESGTGKEVLARAIARRSGRRDRQFIAINCAALPDALLESELFGHVRGAFTGAASARQGLFEEASGGTLFLDEIGDISPAMQVRLLRTLQEGEVRPLGSNEVRKVDVRIIAATHRDLAAAIVAGTFREDLFYRLNVFMIQLPPLRDRSEDMPLLVRQLVDRCTARHGLEHRDIDSAAALLLVNHDWPGNVRELENVIQRAVLLAPRGTITAAAIRAAMTTTITTGAPPAILAPRDRAAEPAVEAEAYGPVSLPFAEARAEAVDEFSRRYLEDALRDADGHVDRAARLASVERSNFRRLLRRYAIGPTGRRSE